MVAGTVVVLAGVLWHIGGTGGPSQDSAMTGDSPRPREHPRLVPPERATGCTPSGGAIPAGEHSASTSHLQKFTTESQAAAILEDPSGRETELAALVSGVAPADLAEVLEFFNDNAGSELNQSLKVRLVRRWTEHDPRAAANWVSEHSTGPTRQEEINGVAIVWADRSPSEALAWVRTLPESAELNAGLLALAYEAARSAPMDAFQMAAELPDGDARDDLIRHTANQWADKNPQEAVAWARQVEDETLRQQLLAGITTAWADKEPAAAATTPAELLPSGRPQDDAVIGIVQRWVQTEPAQAADWVMNFPKGPLQETALEEVVKLWADQDPARTGEWINQLDEDQRDPAVAAYVGKLALSSPDSAAEWAATIRDKTLRNRLMETVATSWMSADPAAARLWATTADLTETMRARLSEPAPN